jgi:hypothetical protein
MKSDNQEPFVESVNWFKKLSEEIQFRIITQLFKDSQQVSEEERKNIEPLIYEVEYLLSLYPKEQVIQNLKEFQIDENIIGVLVDNVIKTRLSFDAFARVLRELDDDKFKNVISGILPGYYLTMRGKNIDALADEIQINRGIIGSARRFIHGIVVRFLSGEVSLEEIEVILANDYHFSNTQIQTLTSKFKENIKSIREVLVFHYMYNVAMDIPIIKNSLDQMWRSIEEMASLLKESRGSREMYR